MATTNDVIVTLKLAGADTFKSQAKGALGAVQSSASVAGRGIKQMGVMGLAAITGLTIGMYKLGKSMIQSASELEQNTIAFETMLGSAKKAKELIAELQTFAKKTPLQLKDLQVVTKRLLAYGVAQKKIIPTLKTLGNISAGLGGDSLPRLVTAFGQIKAKGKLVGQEMLQLTETGLNLRGELAKIKGVSEKTFDAKDIAKWNITFAEFESALKRVERKQFFNLMIKQSATFGGVISNIVDALGIMGQNIATKSGLFDAVKKGAISFLDWIDKAEPKILAFIDTVKRWIGVIRSIIEIVVEKVKRWGGEIQKSPVYQWFKDLTEKINWGQFAKDVGIITVVVLGLAAAFGVLTSPVTIVLIAIAALALAWQWFVLHKDDIKAFLRPIIEKLMPILDQLKLLWGDVARVFKENGPFIKEALSKVWEIMKVIAKIDFAIILAVIWALIYALRIVVWLWDKIMEFGAKLKKASPAVKTAVNIIVGALSPMYWIVKNTWDIMSKISGWKGSKGVGVGESFKRAAGFGAANGGIVPGGSMSGDKVLARVNSGEMVLTRGQQGALFSMLKNMSSNQNINFNAPINFAGQSAPMQQQNQFTNMLKMLV